MAGKYDGLNGRQIIKAAQDEMQKLGAKLAVLVDQDEYPAEHRSRIRRETNAAIRLARSEAQRALAAWARTAADDARRRLASDDVGSPAAESRRVAMELRIGRITGSGRANAGDLAARSNAAYELGNLDEAEVLARASQELGQERQAAEVLALVTYDRNAADPAKAKAMTELADVDVVATAAARDLNRSYSSALQQSVALAKAIGEPSNDVSDDMTGASVEAKLAAFHAAKAEGKPYVEPEGVLAGAAQGVDLRGAKINGKTVDDAR